MLLSVGMFPSLADRFRKELAAIDEILDRLPFLQADSCPITIFPDDTAQIFAAHDAFAQLARQWNKPAGADCKIAVRKHHCRRSYEMINSIAQLEARL